ncbi:cytochrome C biosynthesis protein [Ureibacillus massiliensis 4400831 = CIP 108448 = CCUG 49529]|uniref:Cytochrome C biosynthesis protein n=1 Tax=Ureibacillus massiliensis 4400831 = CIP 108448 = CCUG 49529 TaxID=1211035 RepID=A0A0A3J3H2_9BACL|nr:sulfite exporter TauE/SafE family protein [Ureibacillus massiliensis]KGR89718.1 cytochrome C biosynthesis protein [Ureibacillus massiliensis 4400831 = CIP 108448 = CCUG 49529]
MYSFLSNISGMISEPISAFMYSYEHSPIIVAILLGLIGAFAPCQLTGNISAITFYGNRAIQKETIWTEIAFFIFGKVVVFSLIGWLAWIFGQAFETEMTKYFAVFRKVIGPLLVLTGLVLLGLFKMEFLGRITERVPVIMKEGKLGSFLLGASFSLAFCPTMFVLFFVWLMPTVVSTSYGFALPAVFGIATSIPLLLIFALIEVFDAKRVIMKNSRNIGKVVQNTTGVILIIIGLFDTLTYWGI